MNQADGKKKTNKQTNKQNKNDKVKHLTGIIKLRPKPACGKY